MLIKESYSFQDVLLKPKYSDIESRSTVDVSVKINDFTFDHPIIVANMASTMGPDMGSAFNMMNNVIESGGLAILHRFLTLEEQLYIIKHVLLVDKRNRPNHTAVSVGVNRLDRTTVRRFYEEFGVKIFCIDIAHGHSSKCLDMVEFIKTHYPTSLLIAGNVCTGEGAKRLWEAGVDLVKVNVGAGSTCSTRVVTGNGVPMLSALLEVSETKRYIESKYPERNFYVISDGGCRNYGDMVKSLCLADMCMVGSQFAGSVSCSSNKVTKNGIDYIEYSGSSTHKDTHVEGVKSLVKVKPPYNEILDKMLQALRSGCSYQGVHRVSDLQNNPEFIKLSHAGIQESYPHDLDILI